MTLSNSYVRAAIANVVIFALILVRYLQKYGTLRESRQIIVIISALGVALGLTTLIVGTFSRHREKRWRWLKVIVVSFGCWLAVFLMMLLAQTTLYSR